MGTKTSRYKALVGDSEMGSGKICMRYSVCVTNFTPDCSWCVAIKVNFRENNFDGEEVEKLFEAQLLQGE